MRQFDVPSGLTWADLPATITVAPRLPQVRFSTLTPNVCSVSEAGVVDTPGEYDGIRGTCRVRAVGSGDDEWAAVDKVLVIELDGPPVVVRLAARPQTSFTWADEKITVPLVLNILTNPGRASISASALSGPCSASWVVDSSTRVEFVVEISGPGKCSVSFGTFSSGVFQYNEDLPAPVVFDVAEG